MLKAMLDWAEDKERGAGAKYVLSVKMSDGTAYHHPVRNYGDGWAALAIDAEDPDKQPSYVYINERQVIHARIIWL